MVSGDVSDRDRREDEDISVRADSGGFGGAALVLGLVAVCCGGPLLIVALAATGLGAWLLASGGSALAGAALLAVAVAALWLRQRRWRASRAADPGRRAPTPTSRVDVKP